MKKKILIIFKAPWHWNDFVINKFKKSYEVKHIFLNMIKKNFLQTIDEINDLIDKDKIEIVVFDVDYQKFINHYFIKKIKSTLKIMMTWDDYERHNFNIITANSCNFVITGCPISAFKYKEVGKEASFMILESDGNFYKDLKVKKDIDVLFFGKVNKDRKVFLDYLKENNINLKVVGNNSENRVSDKDLVNLICRSKIVVNFSKTTWGKIMNIPEKNVFSYQYQFKGRIVQAGLCGTACISEYAPHHDLLYKSDELIQFSTKEECFNKISDLLENPNKLEHYQKIFSEKTIFSYEDEKTLLKVNNFIQNFNLVKKNEDKHKLKRLPYWYTRICAKQIILRDLKFFKILNSLVHLKEIFQLIKGSNIFVKSTVILETLINIVWFATIRLFSKKGVGKKRYADEY